MFDGLRTRLRRAWHDAHKQNRFWHWQGLRRQQLPEADKRAPHKRLHK
jgi:hypothetical protein